MRQVRAEKANASEPLLKCRKRVDGIGTGAGILPRMSERQARQVRDALAARLAQVGLELHPDKTRIVYCSVSRTREGA
jgi:hypothetical protein